MECEATSSDAEGEDLDGGASLDGHGSGKVATDHHLVGGGRQPLDPGGLLVAAEGPGLIEVGLDQQGAGYGPLKAAGCGNRRSGQTDGTRLTYTYSARPGMAAAENHFEVTAASASQEIGPLPAGLETKLDHHHPGLRRHGCLDRVLLP